MSERVESDRVKSIVPKIESKSGATLSSGRSFFPGVKETSEPDVFLDLKDLKDKLAQMARMKTVLLENQSVFAEKKPIWEDAT